MKQLRAGKKLRILSFLFLMTTGIFVMTSCTGSQVQRVYHGAVMKGSIVSVADEGVYLCIGSKDGATVGQELDVYSVTAVGNPKSANYLRREKVGKVRIARIVD
ncbi:hypothetical protein EG832_22860, partial [bacterium]|nr:hypothetical protein [bacterium]